MILGWLLIVALLFWGMHRRTGLSGDFLSKDQTTCINGFFIGWVFLRHICDYLFLPFTGVMGPFNRLFQNVEFLFGQFIVVMFLFYSGYGVMTSILRKGAGYLCSFPQKRIFRVLIDFDIAVVLFTVLALFMHSTFSCSRFVLSLIGWDSYGNSNWYIFVVLISYVVTYLIFHFTSASRQVQTICLACVLLAVGFALFYLKEFVWWDTILAYPMGVFYAEKRDRIERFLRQHYSAMFVFLAVVCIAARCFSGLVGLTCPLRVLGLNVRTICFALLVVMLTMKFVVGNPILKWLGDHLFPLYIYQRFAMLLLIGCLGKSFVRDWPVPYILSCVVLTLLFAVIYEKIKGSFLRPTIS